MEYLHSINTYGPHTEWPKKLECLSNIKYVDNMFFFNIFCRNILILIFGQPIL